MPRTADDDEADPRDECAACHRQATETFEGEPCCGSPVCQYRICEYQTYSEDIGNRG